MPNRPRHLRLRVPSLQTLAFVTIAMNALGLFGIMLITADTNRTVSTTTREEKAVTEHRVRNELYHDCLHDFMVGLQDGVNGLISGQVHKLEVKDTCPEPLTPQEIRTLRETHADH